MKINDFSDAYQWFFRQQGDQPMPDGKMYFVKYHFKQFRAS